MQAPGLNNTQLSFILENTTEAVAIASAHNKITWVNQAFCRILETDSTSILNKTPADFSLPGWKLLLSKRPELTLQTASGKSVELKHYRTRLKAETQHYATVHYYADKSLEVELSSQLKDMRDQLLDSRLKDPLTGLTSLRALTMSLEPQLARCRRYQTRLSIIIMQPVCCKLPEQHDRHAQHDRLISQQLNEVSRWADQIAIDPGRRFLLVLPETERSGAVHLAHKINRRLKKFDWLQSLYFGITQWNKLDNPDRLLNRVSRAAETARRNDELIVIL